MRRPTENAPTLQVPRLTPNQLLLVRMRVGGEEGGGGGRLQRIVGI